MLEAVAVAIGLELEHSRTGRIGDSRQSLSCDDSGYWWKALGYAYGLRRVALVLIRDQYRGVSGSTSRTVLEEGVADGRRWLVASSFSASCKSLVVGAARRLTVQIDDSHQ